MMGTCAGMHPPSGLRGFVVAFTQGRTAALSPPAVNPGLHSATPSAFWFRVACYSAIRGGPFSRFVRGKASS